MLSHQNKNLHHRVFLKELVIASSDHNTTIWYTKKPRFKSWFSYNLTENKLCSRAGTQGFFLLWRKLVSTKLYLHIPKPYHTTNKIHISIYKIRALRVNKFITTQETIGKNWFTEWLWIITVNTFFISLWKKHFGKHGHTQYINLSVGSALL